MSTAKPKRKKHICPIFGDGCDKCKILEKKIRQRSSDLDDIEEILEEWNCIGHEYAPGNGVCQCTQKHLVHLARMRNRITGRILFPIGSTCITHFWPPGSRVAKEFSSLRGLNAQKNILIEREQEGNDYDKEFIDNSSQPDVYDEASYASIDRDLDENEDTELEELVQRYAPKQNPRKKKKQKPRRKKRRAVLLTDLEHKEEPRAESEIKYEATESLEIQILDAMDDSIDDAEMLKATDRTLANRLSEDEALLQELARIESTRN